MSDSRLTRRDFLRTSVSAAAGTGLLGLLGPEAFAEAAKDRPNIILFMADDLGYECVGANGSTSYQTPNLDALARGGMRFTHCHATPLCTPSRVQIMTGRYNHRNYRGFGVFPSNEKTFAHALRDAGYATCVVGKWQLKPTRKSRIKVADHPGHLGFDEYCLWQIIGRDSRYWQPRIHENGRLRTDVAQKYGPDVFRDYATGFIERKKDGPFLLYFPMCLTHDPFLRTPDSAGKAAGKQRFFADMVAYMDKIVGRIIAKLDELGLRERTLILFTGDNGTGRGVTSKMGDRRIRGGKGTTTPFGTHVPLIADWKGTLPPGKVCQDLVDFTDFLPTLTAAAGAAPPKGVQLDGRSFLPQLQGKPGDPREWIFCHYQPRNLARTKPTRWAHEKRWKLYADGRFFDLQADAKEKAALNVAELTGDAADAFERLTAALRSMR